MSASPSTFVDVSKPKKTRKRTRKTRPEGTPGHAAAEGYCDQMASGQGAGETHRITPVCAHLHEATADMSKSAEQMAASATNCGSPDVASFNSGRLSEGLGRDQGHQSVSSGDHGNGTGRNDHVAFGHQDLRQSNVSFSDVLARLHTVRGNTVDLGVPDNTPGGFSHAGQVALASFDAANQAGSYRGMQAVNHNPQRADYHQERGSATMPNGSHSLASPESTAVSNKSRLDIMKTALFGA